MDILKKLDNIPALPQSVIDLEKATDLQKIIKIVESDIFITTALLRIVNSSLYSFSRQVVSVQQAVTLLGLEITKSSLLSAAMTRLFNTTLEAYNSSLENFNRTNQVRAIFLFHLGMMTDINLTKKILPVVGILDIGKLYISESIEDSDFKNLFMEEIEEEEVFYVEKFFAGKTAEEISEILFDHWNLPELYAEYATMFRNYMYCDDGFLLLKITSILIGKEHFSQKQIEDVEKYINIFFKKYKINLNKEELLKKIASSIEITQQKIKNS